ncbi:hypothetical protein [Chitinibacter sp. S2-10]|uniref:hypothetical protein n=1 Tax=Chitinibacter sp. S2-10 TaxID=3373597 RepID=UPI003977A5C0
MLLRFLGVIFMLCCASGWAQSQAVVYSESFETGTTLPAGWALQAWQPDVSRAELSHGALHLSSSKANHARVVKAVAVEPNRTYLLSAKVKARGANANKLAAVIGVEGVYASSDTVRDDLQWHTLEVYIKSNDVSSVNLLLGLGHFGNENLGEAWFDEVNLQAVDAIPAGSKVLDMPRTIATAAPVALSAAEQGRASPWLILAGSALVLAVLVMAGAVWLMRRQGAAA